MSAEINLLPQRKIGLFSVERALLVTKIIAVASMILVVSLSILFFLLSRDPTVVSQKLDQKRTIAELDLLQSKTAKYLIIADRLNKIKVVMRQRSTFDTVMQTLADNVPLNVSISGFILDKKTFSLSLTGSDLSLISTSVDNFTKLMTDKKLIKSLTIQGLVTDEKNGKYVLSLSGNVL